MNNPRAKSLFHFTKSPEILKSILKNGIYPRFCLETNWCKYADEEYYAFSISCFCDIPLSRINEHTDSYGHYGLGLTKNWGIKNGLNPVIYFPENGSILKLAHYLLALTGANRHTL